MGQLKRDFLCLDTYRLSQHATSQNANSNSFDLCFDQDALERFSQATRTPSTFSSTRHLTTKTSFPNILPQFQRTLSMNPCKLQLQDKVWFGLCLQLCHRRRENLRTITRSTFAVGVDATGREFVGMAVDEADKNHSSSDNPFDRHTWRRCFICCYRSSAVSYCDF